MNPAPKPLPRPNLRRRQLDRDRRDMAEYRQAHPNCEDCGQPTTQIDHVEPKRMGGTRRPELHSPANYRALCLTCHMLKHKLRPAKG